MILLISTFAILLIILPLISYYITTKCIRVNSITNEKKFKKIQKSWEIERKKRSLPRLRNIRPQDLDISKILKGYGNFGQVYYAYWTDPETNIRVAVAVKELKQMNDEDKNYLKKQTRKEGIKMVLMNNKNILPLIGICYGEKKYMLVTKLMPNGDLKGFLKKNADKIGSKQLLTWALQIIDGLIYISGRDEFHGDLAARNILVHSSTQVLIADFGTTDINSSKYHACFAHRWTAPEVLKGHPFTTKSDVWSLGVLLWELFTFGAEPYGGEKNYAELVGEKKLDHNTIMKLDIETIIYNCMKENPEERLELCKINAEFSKILPNASAYFDIPNDADKNEKYEIRLKKNKALIYNYPNSSVNKNFKNGKNSAPSTSKYSNGLNSAAGNSAL